MKSLKTKILTSIILIVLVAVVITGGVASYLNYTSTIDSLKTTLSESVVIAANQISAELKAYQNLVREFAYNSVLLESAGKEEKVKQIQSIKSNQDFAVVQMLDANGIDFESGKNLSSTDYFQQVKSTGDAYISDPAMNDEVGDMVIYLGVPMTKNNAFAGVMVAGLRAGVLTDIVSSIHIGTGNAAILNKNGDTIGFKEYDLVLQKYNTQKEVAGDPSLKALAEIERNMCAGLSGSGSYHYGGQYKLMAYCPIPNTNGWSTDIAIVIREFTNATVGGLLLTVIIGIITIICAFIVASRLANSIATPLKASAQRLEALSMGDLDSPVLTVKAKDETALLANSLSDMVSEMRAIIQDITHHLGAMSNGDFTTVVEKEYLGGFQPIKNSILQISHSLNQTLGKINSVADQVAGGADQVANGSQALSQGATEQASSVQELAATISEISSQIKNTASNAAIATEQTQQAGRRLSESKEDMEEMIAAMDQITSSSSEIGKIIKTIQDIAFQTNILALNAAVEAARAGAAGKGFAVVADEVRNLASKSSEAANNTTAMISNSIQAVENGTRIADKTAKSLLAVVEDSAAVSDSIAKISQAADEQAASIEQVSMGIDQISAVVQTNSATAEESAAASEELSAQSQTLNDLVSGFHLRNDIKTDSSYLPNSF